MPLRSSVWLAALVSASIRVAGSLAVLLGGAPVQAATVAACSARPVPTDSQVVTCTVDRSMAGRPLRFEARFVGSHDDTRIRLDATLDGAPLTCGVGSRTSLFAEDGEVGLDCRFVAPGSDAAAVLEVALTVHHAQYVSASVTD